MKRRDLVRAVGALGAAGLAGCSGDSAGTGADGDDGPGENEVLVGPDGSLVFEPESLTVETGTTVTWRFESRGHNVGCNPDHTDAASLPEGAEPFASYEGDNQFATDDEGETFEHTFDVAGTYEYVCVPHINNGMTGTVEVEE